MRQGEGVKEVKKSIQVIQLYCGENEYPKSKNQKENTLKLLFFCVTDIISVDDEWKCYALLFDLGKRINNNYQASTSF